MNLSIRSHQVHLFLARATCRGKFCILHIHDGEQHVSWKDRFQVPTAVISHTHISHYAAIYFYQCLQSNDSSDTQSSSLRLCKPAYKQSATLYKTKGSEAYQVMWQKQYNCKAAACKHLFCDGYTYAMWAWQVTEAFSCLCLHTFSNSPPTALQPLWLSAHCCCAHSLACSAWACSL